MSKEAYDDYIRYCRDKEANSQIYEIVCESGIKAVTSSALRVGDLVLVRSIILTIQIPKNTKVPADCVLMRTGDSSSSCFVRTDQLDGETDWKLRYTHILNFKGWPFQLRPFYPAISPCSMKMRKSMLKSHIKTFILLLVLSDGD